MLNFGNRLKIFNRLFVSYIIKYPLYLICIIYFQKFFHPGGSILKSFDRALDRFCYKHPRFGIRNLMLYIVIGNIIVYLFSIMDTTNTFVYYLYFNPQLILQGQVWRLITFIFIPTTSGLLFVALMLYFYYFIGSTLEREWGSGKFTIYYIFGILLTIIYGFISGLLTNSGYMLLDSSYINLSMFFAFAALFPETRVLLFFFIPIKIKWLAIVDAAFFAISMLITPFPLNLLPLVAVANFFLFCGNLVFGDAFRRARANNKNATQFRTAVHRAKYEEAQQPYRHKCAVCGRTDTEYPNLEFRYCSRCAGYRCFCSDHINNHVHFTDPN